MNGSPGGNPPWFDRAWIASRAADDARQWAVDHPGWRPLPAEIADLERAARRDQQFDGVAVDPAADYRHMLIAALESIWLDESLAADDALLDRQDAEYEAAMERRGDLDREGGL